MLQKKGKETVMTPRSSCRSGDAGEPESDEGKGGKEGNADVTRNFLNTCVQYAARHKRICIVTGSVLLAFLAFLFLLGPDEMLKEPAGPLFIIGTCIAIMLVGFHYEKKARRNTRNLICELGLDIHTLARQYAAGYHIGGKGHEITVTSEDILLFNKNGLTYIPLSYITNVSKFTFIVNGKLGFMVNIILHIPDGSMRQLKSHLESVYGVNADLSARKF